MHRGKCRIEFMHHGKCGIEIIHHGKQSMKQNSVDMHQENTEEGKAWKCIAENEIV